MFGKPIKEGEAALLAEKILQFTHKEGLWPTIDFIVKRWSSLNPGRAEDVKSAVMDERSILTDEFGSNELTRKGNMPLRRLAEVPGEIVTMLEILFKIEIQNYPGGEKVFWQHFARRYPIFKVADKI